MRTLEDRIKKFLDQRQHVLWEEHERVYATKKLVEIFELELKAQLKKRKLQP